MHRGSGPRRIGRGDAGERELLRRAVLERAEGAPAAAPGLGGEEAAMGLIPSCLSARPIWVRRVLETFPPAPGVWK